MLGNIVVYLCLAVILGVTVAWVLTKRSDSRTAREEAAEERPTRQG